MSSKPGGNKNSWNGPVKLTMKVVLAKLGDAGMGPVAAVKSFRTMFPKAQEYFKYPLTDDMISGRIYWNVPSKTGENPYTNKKMSPFVPAADEIIRQWRNGVPPMSNAELSKFCSSYSPAVVKTVSKRRTIPESVRNEHVAMVNRMGGMCPCCGFAKVVKSGKKIAGEFDHFFSNQLPNFEYSWLICKSCHDAMTYNRTDRNDIQRSFAIYQERSRIRKQEAAK